MQQELVKAMLFNIKTCGTKGGVRAHDLLIRSGKSSSVTALCTKWQIIKTGLQESADEMDMWVEDDDKQRGGKDQSFQHQQPKGTPKRKERDRHQGGNRSRGPTHHPRVV